MRLERDGTSDIQKLERIFGGANDLIRTPNAKTYRISASASDNFERRGKLSLSKQFANKNVSQTPTSKTEARNYIDFLRAKYVPEPFSSPRANDVRLSTSSAGSGRKMARLSRNFRNVETGDEMRKSHEGKVNTLQSGMLALRLDF